MNYRHLIDASLLMTVVVYGILFSLAIAGGIFGIVLFWLLALSLWRYGYAVLRSVAQGKPSIPPLSVEDMNFANEFVLVAHFLMFPALAVFINQTSPFGTDSAGQLLSSIVVLLILFLFPASAAVMGLTSIRIASLRPRTVISVIKLLGRDYLILVSSCLGLSGLSYFMQAVLLARFGSLWGVGAIMFAIWTFLAVFAFIGASLHAHRNEVVIPGMPVSRDELDANELKKERQTVLDRAYASVRSGLVTEGYRTLRQFVVENGLEVDLQYWLFENTLEWEDKEPTLRIGLDLIEQLVEEKAVSSAFKLYLRCRDLSSHFTLGSVGAGELADYAHQIGQLEALGELRPDDALLRNGGDSQ